MLPVLLFGVALGALGLKKSNDAKKIMEKASSMGRRAESKYKEAIDSLEKEKELVNIRISDFEEFKKDLFLATVGYVVKRIENSRSEAAIFDESIGTIDFKNVQQFFSVSISEVSALSVGASIGATGAIGAFGVLGPVGMIAGPAFAIKGYSLASEAEEALTEAIEYAEEVDVAINQLLIPKAFLEALSQKIEESKFFLTELNTSFIKRRDIYESFIKKNNSFVSGVLANVRGEKYKAALASEEIKLLAPLVVISKAIKKIIELPVLDSEGSVFVEYDVRAKEIIKAANISIQNHLCQGCGEEFSSVASVCEHCGVTQEARFHKHSSVPAKLSSNGSGAVSYTHTVPAIADGLDMEFQTDDENSFYFAPKINKKKLDAFISKISEKINPEDVFCYFDETLFGKGDAGICLAVNGIYIKEQFESYKYLSWENIVSCDISGALNKKIKLVDDRGSKVNIELTQSNKNADKINDVINILLSRFKN